VHSRAIPAAVHGDTDVADVDVAQRHDDGRAVVAPDCAIAVVAGVVDSQFQLVDFVAAGRAEESFDHVCELGGRIWDDAAVVVVGGGDLGLGRCGQVGTVGWREGGWGVDACEVEGAGLADQGGCESVEYV